MTSDVARVTADKVANGSLSVGNLDVLTQLPSSRQ